MKEKLLHFIDTTTRYDINRLFAQLPSDGLLLFLPRCFQLAYLDTDLYEVKAILLGRSGRHDNALEIYVYRLQDFLKAEE
jgi:Vam6/Vps39-like protein vacuolar protein sorting-associated protein 39